RGCGRGSSAGGSRRSARTGPRGASRRPAWSRAGPGGRRTGRVHGAGGAGSVARAVGSRGPCCLPTAVSLHAVLLLLVSKVSARDDRTRRWNTRDPLIVGSLPG